MTRREYSIFLAPALLMVCSACAEATADDSTATSADEALRRAPCEGAVFTMSNAASGNTVLAFRRSENGSLQASGEYATGGLGSGAALGSQGSVTLSEDGHFLLVVNAGSNEISSFSVQGPKLTLRSTLPSGGAHPTSVAVRNHRAYVLNAGSDSNIAGFRLNREGQLTPIPNSIRALSMPSPAAAEVAIAPWGLGVVVTEKGTNLIDTFPLDHNGTLGPIQTTPSSGGVPYGFDISPEGVVVISEAAAGAVSSYAFGTASGLAPISPSVSDHQGAPCWLVITKDGRFAYTANAASSSISGYRLEQDGSLQLLDATGVTASTGVNGKPLDLATDQQKHLYVVDAGNQEIDGFSINGSGALTPVGSTAGMPRTVVGIAAL